ncbi:hypothetical protein [Streptomyces flavofungini]|uniref:Uncharacterized protein n=1 Tax=Streptomyces flavofungini TaxID=68200 RepID=A0ABS0X658_9ACTN|nr:hypothetical protein [Streptomyces flavofungini]MBJ3808687.1 hypothetical protein [Streptomyces flavofungini]GHC50045.1 hypothetical protein GCM10010349_14610 [Streptomyces flavofungini]
MSGALSLGRRVYFQVLEALLEEEHFVERAIPFMREATRKETARLLISYENPVPDALRA